MIKINKHNYEFYKEVLKVIWEFEAEHLKMQPNSEFSPLNILRNWEKQSDYSARRVLKEGLRDSLTLLKDFPCELKAQLNTNLTSHNFPSLKILISKIRNVPKRILEKGKIKNLDEYYVLKEVLNDMDYGISETERTELHKILEAFELEFKEN